MILDASGREVRRAIGFLRNHELVDADDPLIADVVSGITIDVPKSWTVSGPRAQKGSR